MAKPKFKITTEERGTETALSFWEDRLYAAGAGGKLSPEKADVFSASMTGYAFGRSDLCLYARTASTHDRTRLDCAQSPSDLFCLSYMKKGTALVRQAGREAAIKPGSCFLAYSGDPLTAQLSAYESLILSFPSALLQSWLPQPFDATAVSFSKHNPWGKALAVTLGALRPESGEELSLAPDILMEQVICLLALAAGPTQTVPENQKQALLFRLRQAMRARFHEPVLSPACLAQDLGISPRTLFATFASAGTSFGRELLTLRMEKARQYLESPRFDQKTVAEIGGLVGYIHTSHFITHFRQAFSFTPAAFRKIRQS